MSQFTKYALEEALKKLLRERPLDKITIQDLTDECGISRSSFYYHFQDIYDLVEWACIEDFSKALGSKRTYDTWEEGLTQIMEEVKNDRDFIYNIYRYMDHQMLTDYLDKRTRGLLYDVIEEEAAGFDVTDDQKQFIADYYTQGMVWTVLTWVEENMKTPIGDVVSNLSVMLKGSFRRALESYDLYNKKKIL